MEVNTAGTVIVQRKAMELSRFELNSLEILSGWLSLLRSSSKESCKLLIEECSFSHLWLSSSLSVTSFGELKIMFCNSLARSGRGLS